jgi:hypothetical protein
VTFGGSAPYNRGMKRPPIAVLLGAVALSGCASSGRKPEASVHSGPPVAPPARLRAEISSARASDPSLFAIFPTQSATARCAIPVSEGMQDSRLEGTCRTRVWYPDTHGHGEARVVFRESWGSSRFSSWTLWEELPTLKVLATTLHGKPAPQLRYAATGPKHPAAIRYRSENLTLYAPRPGYRPAVSRSEVLRLYHSWPAGPKLKGSPTVQLRLVNDGNPNPSDRDYPGWVVTFHHTKPASYGLASVSQKADCAWVSVYDLRTRVWTEDFQSCPNRPAPGSSCDSGCTPANQPALDAAAAYAQQVAGDAHRFAGVAVDDDANKVIVYLVRAPQSILDELRARHPGIYAIHNDAPHTLSDITALQKSIDWSAWKARRIEIVSTGPTETGFLRVGVTKHVPQAQAAFDAKYGRGIIRVVKAEPVIAASLGGR